MAAGNYFNERAQQHFNQLDADAKRILQRAFTEDPENIGWVIDTVFSKKKNQKTTKVTFDMKLKCYTTIERSNPIPENEATKLHLGYTFIHYRYHPEREQYVHIPNPPRSENSSNRYVVMAQNCHLIKGRDITVGAFAVQKAGTTTTSLCSAIREAPTKKAITQKGIEDDTYVQLVKTIIDKINHITSREEHNANIDQEVDEINGLIDIMKEKNIHPKCKQLYKDTIKGDFVSAGEDENILKTTKEVLDNQVNMNTTIAEWKENSCNSNRIRNREKYKEQWGKKYANLTTLKTVRGPEMSSEASYASTHASSGIPSRPQGCTTYATQTTWTYPEKYWKTFLYLKGNQIN